MTRITTFLKHNAIGLAALFIALGGTSYAAVAIPSNSVGARQLRSGAVSTSKLHNGAVTATKLSGGSFGGRILDYAEIEPAGAVQVSDPKGIETRYWDESGPNQGGLVVFPHRLPKGCFPLAGPATPVAAGGAPPSVGVGLNGDNAVVVRVSALSSVTVTIICPAR